MKVDDPERTLSQVVERMESVKGLSIAAWAEEVSFSAYPYPGYLLPW